MKAERRAWPWVLLGIGIVVAVCVVAWLATREAPKVVLPSPPVVAPKAAEKIPDLKAPPKAPPVVAPPVVPPVVALVPPEAPKAEEVKAA